MDDNYVVRGEYGTEYCIGPAEPDEVIASIDYHLRMVRKNNRREWHPDLDRLLDRRYSYLRLFRALQASAALIPRN